MRVESWHEEKKRLKQWHKYFAWEPVTVGTRAYWLQFVERKGLEYYAYADMWDFEYRLIREDTNGKD